MVTQFRYRLFIIGIVIVLMLHFRASAAQASLEIRIDRFITDQMVTQHILGLALAITHEN